MGRMIEDKNCEGCRKLVRWDDRPEDGCWIEGLYPGKDQSQDDRGYREDNDAFGRLLVKAVAREGRSGHAGDAWESGRYSVLSTNERKDAHTGMPAVELTEAQAGAVLELMRWMRKTVDASYRAGVRRGHSMILRLAQGETGPADYEAQKARELGDDV